MKLAHKISLSTSLLAQFFSDGIDKTSSDRQGFLNYKKIILNIRPVSATKSQSTFCNFSEVKNHIIANSSTNTKAKKRRFVILRVFKVFDVRFTKSITTINYPCLLNKIFHRFPVTTKIFIGGRTPVIIVGNLFLRMLTKEF